MRGEEASTRIDGAGADLSGRRRAAAAVAWPVQEGAGPYHADGLEALAAGHGEDGYLLIACFGIAPGGVVEVHDRPARGAQAARLTAQPDLKAPQR